MQHANLPDVGRVSHFQIDGQLPTPAEKAALAGDPVPPGDANRYLTQNHAAGGFDGFANPSASVGLVAANGVATTAMRSDAAPALDQSITPTWVGLHTFGAGLAVSAGQGVTMADDAWIGIGAALERIIFDAAGDIAFMGCNVGIGTTVPGAKLQLYTGWQTISIGADTGQSYIANNAQESSGTWSVKDATYHGLKWETQIGTSDAATYHKFDFVDKSGAESTAMVIRKDGNVGIGTNAPGTLLELESTAPYLTLVNNTHEDGDGGRESRLIFEGEQTGGERSALGWIQASHNGAADDEKGQLGFYTNDGSDGAAPTLAMTIDETGNVGIGTTGPSRRLTVNHTTGDWASFQYNGTETLSIQDTATNIEFATPNVSTDRGFTFKTYTGEKVTITKDGNVGIGTTGPLARLHVDQSSGTGAIPVVTMDQADIDVVLFKVIAAAAAAGVDYTLVADSDYGTPGALVGWIQIEIDDVGNRIADGDYYIPFYAAPS